MAAHLLEVENLDTRIKLHGSVLRAVDGLSFHVDAGETLGIVGESGCGKTMTALSIMRLLPRAGYIAGGEIHFDGRDMVKAGEAEMRQVRGNEIGMVFQDPMTSLNPTMTVGRQIAEGVKLHQGGSRSAAMTRAAEILGLVGMPRPAERLRDYPHQLSGGMRQRVMIAMALACSPKLLIADEPTSAVDVTIQAQILALLDTLKAELGLAVILITHDMGVIAHSADRMIVMYAGEKVESADADELFGNLRHPYTEALLASIPRLDQDKTQSLYSIPGQPPDLTRPPEGCRFAPRCVFATEKCRTEKPELGGPDPGHVYSCFHPRRSSAADVGEAGAALFGPAPASSGAGAGLAPGVGSVMGSGSGVDSASGVGLASGPDLGSGSAPAAGEVLLELRNVSKEYPAGGSGIFVGGRGLLRHRAGASTAIGRGSRSVKAVTEVSLVIRRGETFGLVGESGCGKTTLGRLGVALEAPTAGQVVFDGADLGSLRGRELRRRRRDLQMIFQDPYASLDPRMRVKEIVREPLDVARRGSSAERDLRVRDLLSEVGLPPEALERYPHEFSGGQRQRLGLARALSVNPKMIVADETVSALDVSIRAQILNLMRQLQEAHGLTYMVISHDMSVVRYMADRIGIMYLGRLVEIGSSTDIYEEPAHPYTAGLLAAIPVVGRGAVRAGAGEVRDGAEVRDVVGGAAGLRGGAGTWAGAVVPGELPSAVDPPSGCRFRTRCPRAQKRCAEEVPELTSFGGEHFAACHFPLRQPVETEPAPAAPTRLP